MPASPPPYGPADPIRSDPITRPRQLALVQWSGEIGGAETMTVVLAAQLRQLGVDARVVFITDGGRLGHRLSAARSPHRSLGFRRGRDLVRHCRRYANEVASNGRDGAILPECGFISVALRAGGYRAPIVGVEHGALLLTDEPGMRRTLHRVGRVGAARVDDAEVAVSDFMLGRMRQRPHARRLARIYNGVEIERCVAERRDQGADRRPAMIVGYAGRLIPGKGLDCLLGALVALRSQAQVELLVAGDGPEWARLATLVGQTGLRDNVNLLGVVDDMRSFWARCDVAVVPSTALESFSMSALEAMACGKPVIATRIGGIPEVVIDGVTGTLVTPGDASALARAVLTYAKRPQLRASHGHAARAHAIERFDIAATARAYLALLEDLAARRPAHGACC